MSGGIPQFFLPYLTLDRVFVFFLLVCFFAYGHIYKLTDAWMREVACSTQGWCVASESGSVTAALRPCHRSECSADELSLSL